MASASYDKKDLGNGEYLFEVTGQGASFIRIILFSIIVSSMVTSLLTSIFNPGSFLMLVFIFVWFCLVYGIFRFWKKLEAKNLGGSFKVTSASIETNGKVFNTNDITRLVLRNSMDSSYSGGAFVGGSGIAGGAAASVAALSNLNQQRAMARSYYVGVESGGKQTRLAAGMDEITAHGLFTEVGRIIGFD